MDSWLRHSTQQSFFKSKGLTSLNGQCWQCQRDSVVSIRTFRSQRIVQDTIKPQSHILDSEKANNRFKSHEKIRIHSATATKSFLLGLTLALLVPTGYLYLTDARSAFHRHVLVKLSQSTTDAETAHERGTGVLKLLWSLGLYPRERASASADEPLHTTVLGHSITSPLAISAGLDKEGILIDPLFALGAGIVEIGGVTPFPQEGNAKPRFWRIPSQEAFLNRLGLNSSGAMNVARTLQRRVRDYAAAHGYSIDDESERRILNGEAGVPPGSLMNGRLLAVQIARNASTPEKDMQAVRNDYLFCVDKLAKYADIIVINVSSPNTPGLRNLQQVAPLTSLLKEVVRATKSTDRASKPAVMVKVSPDEDSDLDIRGVCDAVWKSGVDGVIVGNTTKKRPPFADPSLWGPNFKPVDVQSPSSGEQAILAEQGGYSGPLRINNTIVLVRKYRQALDARSVKSDVPHGAAPKVIFASGGISHVDHAVAALDAGASVAMVYTAMMYQGAGFVASMKSELRRRIEAESSRARVSAPLV